MTAPSFIELAEGDPGDLATLPPAGSRRILVDVSTHEPAVQDDTGSVSSLVGPPGAAGADGADGANGVGVPTGGTTGQRLAKASGADYDTEWVTPSGETEILDIPTAETDTSLVLAPDGAGGVEFRAESGGGSDLVQVAAGAGSIRVPGIALADRVPASPSASDDEFDALSGWTTHGTLDTSEVSTYPSHWHGKRLTGGQNVNGLFKAAPSMPFTVTAKFPAGTGSGNNPYFGLWLLDATPTALWTAGWLAFSGFAGWNDLYRAGWTDRTTKASNSDFNAVYQIEPPVYPYLRLVVHSSTNVDVQYSRDGIFWNTAYSGINPGFTIANVGLFIGCITGTGTIEVLCDWIRFT